MRDLYSNDVETAARLAAYEDDVPRERPTAAELEGLDDLPRRRDVELPVRLADFTPPAPDDDELPF